MFSRYKRLILILLVIALFTALVCDVSAASEYKLPNVSYNVHCANVGWVGAVTSGGVGRYSSGYQMEAFAVSTGNSSVSGGITYRAYVSSGRYVAGAGWDDSASSRAYGMAYMNWVKDGATAGTIGVGKPMEGIEIKLYGEMANGYDVKYRVYRLESLEYSSGGIGGSALARYFSWSDWVENGEYAGTKDYACPIGAIQIQLVPKSFVQTTKHYKYNPNSKKWDLWKSSTNTKKYGSICTPAYATEPVGYYRYKKDAAYTVTGTKTSSVYYYPKSVEIGYETGGGELENPPPSILYGETGLRIPNPVKKGYVFKGWQRDGDNKTVKDLELSCNSESSIRLTAVYDKNCFSVRFPVELILDEEGKCSYNVAVKGSICSEDKISVIADKAFVLKDKSGSAKNKELTVKNTISGGEISGTELSLDEWRSCTGMINCEHMEPGVWEGSFSLEVSLK